MKTKTQVSFELLATTAEDAEGDGSKNEITNVTTDESSNRWRSMLLNN